MSRSIKKDVPSIFCLYGTKSHLIDIVNDGDEEIVVYKQWRASKKYWDYFSCRKWEILEFAKIEK